MYIEMLFEYLKMGKCSLCLVADVFIAAYDSKIFIMVF